MTSRASRTKRLKLKRLRGNINISVCCKAGSYAYRRSGFTHTQPVGVAVDDCCYGLCMLVLLCWLAELLL